MNVSSTYLSHIDGFSDVDPDAISSKYSMYMLANTGDNGETITKEILLNKYSLSDTKQFFKVVIFDFLSYASEQIMCKAAW